jgi:cyclopropane-fatty-acyl-phospholipid synthase
VRFQDYRDLAESFDRLVSIEMIEAVGEAHWSTYFATLSRALRQGGVAVLQAITIREEDFALYRSRPDFIQRYIFPGGMLPTVSAMDYHAQRAGLELQCVRRFGNGYAWTLREWRRRFLAAWPQIEALGFDDRFRRMWDYYLVYCEAGFERGVVDVGTYRLRKA